MGYRIKTVAELLGVPRNTLLSWERRYCLVAPVRQANGYREYRDEDLAILQRLKHHLDQGLKISEAVSLLRAQHSAPAAQVLPPTDATGPVREQLLQALSEADRSRADALARQLGLMPWWQALGEIYYPLLRRIGHCWEDGELSVAQEHFASAWIRARMVTMLTAVDHGPKGGIPTIMAGFPGEQHDLGLLGAAVKLALKGHRITWLGPNLPTADLLGFFKAHRTQLVCTSVVMPPPEGALLDWVGAVQGALPPKAQVWVGGAALRTMDLPPIEGVRWVPPTHC